MNEPNEQPIEEVDVDFEEIPTTETEVFEEESPQIQTDYTSQRIDFMYNKS